MGGHDHAHGGLGTGARHQGRLVAVLILTALFMVVEVATAVMSHSLALLSDAGHMMTDVFGLSMALAAIVIAHRHHERGAKTSHTYGLFRLEIIASFCNALLLFVVAGYVLFEALQRIGSPPDVTSTPMLVVAILGLIVNVISYLLLREGADESINVQGAFLEVIADMVGSIGVIIAAVLLKLFAWTWADAVIGVAIGVWILPRAWKLGGRSIHILLQAAPVGVDLGSVAEDLTAIEGVMSVHDLHIWTLTSGMDTASAHLTISDDANSHSVLDASRAMLHDRYGIGHATLQIEPANHTGCDEVGW